MTLRKSTLPSKGFRIIGAEIGDVALHQFDDRDASGADLLISASNDTRKAITATGTGRPGLPAVAQNDPRRPHRQSDTAHGGYLHDGIVSASIGS